MTARGEEQLQAIQQDLACPACEYNLRGLLGDVVVCPECGSRVDAARLISHEWTGRWYHAPGYTPLCTPTAVAMAAFIGLLFGLGASNGDLPELMQSPFWLSGMVIVSVVWIMLMVRAVYSFGNRRGLWLSLLAIRPST